MNERFHYCCSKTYRYSQRFDLFWDSFSVRSQATSLKHIYKSSKGLNASLREEAFRNGQASVMAKCWWSTSIIDWLIHWLSQFLFQAPRRWQEHNQKPFMANFSFSIWLHRENNVLWRHNFSYFFSLTHLEWTYGCPSFFFFSICLFRFS